MGEIADCLTDFKNSKAKVFSDASCGGNPIPLAKLEQMDENKSVFVEVGGCVVLHECRFW